MESRVSPQAPGAHLPDHPDFLWRNPEPKRSYDVVIIGGGGHGLATAHYLVKNHGITNVAVLEKGWLAGGNMARNTTLIRSNYPFILQLSRDPERGILSLFRSNSGHG